ncbi:MAG: phytanoyl-CoA dioxygenase family protein [Candidatus Poribacteria bacterium]|nr:phytanoyl-CoA dioxygenase family protein [Candidatus Poribacteria bacterium]
MELTYAQKREIFENGFVKLPGVVPRVMVDVALRAINSSVGEGMNPDDMVTFRSRSYCPELQREPVITDLLSKTPAWLLAESAIGAGKIKPATGGQIALRFPTMQDPPRKPGGHLDGMHSPNNGVPKGVIRNFTMLVGVYLSDVPNPYSGNFTVWPGTHHIYEGYFREHGPESLLNGMPPVELPKPQQITGKAGDAIFCHYQVAHGAAPNASPHTRYAIFFRLRHIEHDDFRPEAMTDIWLDWEGMRDIMGRGE